MTNRRYSINTARVAFMLALVSLSMIVLAACGSNSSATDTPTLPTSAPTSAIQAPTAVMTGEVVTAVATTGPTDMPLMDATATTGNTSTSDGALPTQTAAGQTTGGTATEIKGVLKEWAIDLSSQTAPAGKIRFTVTNEGRMRHNFTVTDSSGTIAQTSTFDGSAGAQTLDVDLQAGTYTIICDLPGHAARGQKTTLVVK